MISKKTKYAFKALIALAGQPSGQPMLIADLARQENIPKKFLEFILLSLRKGGILQSRIGKGGGYYLLLPPAKISVGMVIRILESDLAPVPCLSDTNYAHCDECYDEATCGIKLVMTDVNNVLTSILDSLSLADMLDRSQDACKRRENVLDYSI